ncbi:hypothetical protein MYX82_06405 [Acidobacteria bacterium AH-259-D05]|nr:hypothetical protein [Acidobacteria bacterium AH-259-D05]
MMVIAVETEPTFRSGRPEMLFEGSYATNPLTPGFQYYDISPDGKKFLMVKPSEQESSQIHIVENWFEELKRLVPTGE